MSAYLECIANDPKVLSSFYRSSALLRDDELTSVIVRLFSSLSDVRFTLPLNVASLNLWQPGPLILCGLWQRLEDVEVRISVMNIKAIYIYIYMSLCIICVYLSKTFLILKSTF